MNKEYSARYSISSPDPIRVFAPTESDRMRRGYEIGLTIDDQQNHIWGFRPEVDTHSPESKKHRINWKLFESTINDIASIKVLANENTDIPKFMPVVNEILRSHSGVEKTELLASFLAGFLSVFPGLPIVSSVIIDAINIYNTIFFAGARVLQRRTGEDVKMLVRYFGSTIGEMIVGVAPTALLTRLGGVSAGNVIAGGGITGTLGLGTGFLTNTFWQRLIDSGKGYEIASRNLKEIEKQMVTDDRVRQRVLLALEKDRPELQQVLSGRNGYLRDEFNGNLVTSTGLKRLQIIYQNIDPENRLVIRFLQLQLKLEEARVHTAARLRNIINLSSQESN